MSPTDAGFGSEVSIGTPTLSDFASKSFEPDPTYNGIYLFLLVYTFAQVDPLYNLILPSEVLKYISPAAGDDGFEDETGIPILSDLNSVPVPEPEVEPT
jgi:hypothetical protein